MALRLKNTSDIAKIFGVTSVGSFINNEAIKNNPQIIQLLLAKQERSKAYKTKKKSSFELNYYQNLLMRSEQLKAERAKGLERINTLDKTKIGLVKINTENLEQSEAKLETVVQSNIEDLNSTKDVKENYLGVYLRSESKDRYYNLSITKNLFGEYSLIRSWGGLKSKLGNYKIVFYDKLEMAQEALKFMTKQRIARGYKILENK